MQRAESGEYSSQIRVGFVSYWDSRAVKSWSGTPYNMARSLEKQFGELLTIGPFNFRGILGVKIYRKLFRLAYGKNFSIYHTELASRQFSAQARKEIRASKPDVIISPAGSTVSAGIPKEIPLVYLSDATFRLIDGYHPNYRHLSPSSKRIADRLERQAIGRADLLLYPSEWAAQSAIQDYGASPDKVHVIPWGANLKDPPVREQALKRRPHDVCRLLFIGVNWKEKGGDIALGALKCLRERGIQAELTICGCEPPYPISEPGVRIHPFLDKNDIEDLRIFNSILDNAMFFILPTRADCYGIAFCEAAAFGLPSIGTATGGVPGVVREGENGHLLPMDANAEDYADVIETLFVDESRYRSLQVSSRMAYENRLNWDRWGQKAAELIRLLVSGQKKNKLATRS